MNEVCSDTQYNLIIELTGSDDNIRTLYKTGTRGYDLKQSELLSTVLLALTLGTLVAIHLETIEEEEIVGYVSHVFTIVKLDMDRYNIIQTYGGVYYKRKYTTITHIELIELLLELHALYTKPTRLLIKTFYSKWFYVTLKEVSYPNYLHITTI